MKPIQENVKDFVSKYNLEAKPEIRMLDLSSEVGELAKEVIKGTDYGKQEFVKTEKIEDEIGDVMFSLICLANSMNVELDKALNSALEKYRKRMDEKGDLGSGR